MKDTRFEDALGVIERTVSAVLGHAKDYVEAMRRGDVDAAHEAMVLLEEAEWRLRVWSPSRELQEAAALRALEAAV